MATLVLNAVGSAIGGPLGGAFGALAGRAIDTAIFGTPKREGPRLKELDITTSSYGSAIARHYGTVRTAGSIIWATDLKEHKENGGGGKGKPKVTTYTYSISFAVALASRPIAHIGRIWADGNLLRGASGDLKVGGKFRFYNGSENQDGDPLIQSAIGENCPGFRGMAYAVFEDLQLADYGNRIPTLTFEIVADTSQPEFRNLMEFDLSIETDMILPGLVGISYETGSEAEFLSMVRYAYDLACDGSAGTLSIRDGLPNSSSLVSDLPPPIVSTDDGFGKATGTSSRRQTDRQVSGIALRYYDIDRDYQPGLQRGRARSGNGAVETIEFPACLAADDARRLACKAAARRESRRERMSYRIATLDPAIAPGSFVRPAGSRGVWQVRSWEWRAQGIELELEALSPELSSGLVAGGDAGQAGTPPDLTDGPTILSAFELPWDGIGSGQDRRVYAAVSSPAAGWSGAALYIDSGDSILQPAGSSNRERSTVGTALTELQPASPHILDRSNSLIVQLVDPTFTLASSDMSGLAQGENRARIGSEILQFATAASLGGGQWRLSNLLRGRGGTEHAIDLHQAGETFVLLDETLTLMDQSLLGTAQNVEIVALGNLDMEPLVAPVESLGISLRPLEPVKGRLSDNSGEKTITWVRRARGAWHWLDEVEVPLGEADEKYEIRFVDGQGGQLVWFTAQPTLQISSSQWSQLMAQPQPHRLEIRQVGSFSLSRPLTINL